MNTVFVLVCCFLTNRKIMLKISTDAIAASLRLTGAWYCEAMILTG